MGMRAQSERADPEAIHAALDRVCRSRPFAASPKLTSFLRFVVAAVLAGRGDRLKGYTIAVEALGRGEGFDPQSDSIVRVEAMRLRRALKSYYQGEGARDPVVIDIPVGGYRPSFHRERRARPLLIWLAARGWLQRLLAAQGPWLLPPPPPGNVHFADGRQVQQAQGAPAARPRRPRPGRDRGDAADGRENPRGL
jgi:hypothetical protein